MFILFIKFVIAIVSLARDFWLILKIDYLY